MPHSRTGSQGKGPKKHGGKKGSSPSASPLDRVVEISPSIESDHHRPLSHPKDMETRPRSKSYSAAAVAAQILSQFNPIGESNTPARRRATTKASELRATQKSPDVFQFLDQEITDESSASKAPRKTEDPPTTIKPATKERKRKPGLRESFDSDSGVSMREYSPDRASSVDSRNSAEYQTHTSTDMPFADANWQLATASRTRLPMAGAFLTDTETIVDSSAAHTLVDSSAPEAYYYPKQPPSLSDPVMPMRKTSKPKLDLSSLKLGDKRRRSSSASGTTLPVTSRLTINDTRPRLYRKFRDLNHRLLCHLQEEIAQLEDDLATLDELEEVQHSPSNPLSSPRQKALAAKFQDLQISDWSVLRYKRQELMETVLTKTEQYHRTLYTYSKTIKALPPASEQDVDSYRAAAQGNMTRVDRRILGHDKDLILLDPSHLHNRPNPLYATVSALFASILLPLLAFGAISEFFGRIVVVAFTGAAIAFWASHGPPGNEYMIAPQNGWAYAVLYFTFMSIAAMIIP